MQNQNAVLILARTTSTVVGLDADLNWVRLNPTDTAAAVLDVINGAGTTLRTATPNVLQSEKFAHLFNRTPKLFGADSNPNALGLFHIQNMKIYKVGDDFKCAFIYGGVEYSDRDMTCPGYRIDGYELPAGDIVVDGATVIGVFATANAAPFTVDLSAPKQNPNQFETIARIEQRMSEIQHIADEYNRLKSELVTIIKETNSNLKNTYEGKFYRAIYTPPSTRHTIDSDKLKADGLYENYVKISQSSPSVRIVKIIN